MAAHNLTIGDSMYFHYWNKDIMYIIITPEEATNIKKHDTVVLNCEKRNGRLDIYRTVT
jgi:hypothetical protein